MLPVLHLRWTLVGCLLLAFTSGVGISAELTPADIEFFEKKIRPVLVEHCYACHSAEADEVGGKLLLDTAEGVAQGGVSGPLLVPNAADQSLLIQALRYEGTEMPPEAPLPATVINDFVAWIERGAPDPRLAKAEAALPPATGTLSPEQHWSFFPRSQPPVPAVRDATWPRDLLDRFVLARIEASGWAPTHDAPPRTRLRRLYYDLVGLPPTHDELQSFLAAYEQDPELAWRRCVDALLASPQFGERWGRHWLDVARYGESNGDDGLGRNASFPHAWRYRNYVIQSMNEDVPYDQFLTEQIAGDLLPATSAAQRNRQLVATGFLAIGAKPAAAMNDNFSMDIVDDQINVISTGILGLSVACARCHDHKHDPISTQDYYALAGVFTSTETLYGRAGDEGLTAPPTPLHELVSKWQEDQPQPPRIESTPKFPEDYKTAIDELQPIHHDTLDAAPTGLKVEGDAQFSPDNYAHVDNAAILGEMPASGPAYSVAFWFKNELANNERPVTAYLFSRGPLGKQEVGEHLGIGGTHDPDKTGKLFVFNGSDASQSCTGYTEIPSGTWNHVVLVRQGDQIRLYLNGVTEPEISGTLSPTFGEEKAFSLATRADRFAPLKGSLAEFAIFDRALSPAAIQVLHSASAQPKGQNTSPPIGLAMGIRDRGAPTDCKIHINGETSKLGPVVPRGLPTAYQSAAGSMSDVLHFPEDSSGRRELAQWLTHPDHPQTARVLVNRIWLHLFGQAIVETPDDFGVYGARPTHPELLDHLAQRLIDEGWSLKRLIRLIVLSRTYQLDSYAAEPLRQADPENRLFARHRRRRLDAESLRDSLLQAGGVLDLTPRQGSDVDSTVALINWPLGESTNLHQPSFRRSIYLCMLRHAPPPELTPFDLPDFVSVTGQRNDTTLPTQALFLLNSPLVVKLADGLAGQLLAAEPLDDKRRIVLGYQRVLQRDPSPIELERAVDFIHSLKSQLTDEPGHPVAWASWCQAMLATSEFYFVD